MRTDRGGNAGMPLLVLALLSASQSPLFAQVDEQLVTKPWNTQDFWAETYDRPYLIDLVAPRCAG